MLLARTLEKPQKEPTFQTVKMTPMKPLPVGEVKSAEPFIPHTQPVDRPQIVDWPKSTNPEAIRQLTDLDFDTESDDDLTNLSCLALLKKGRCQIVIRTLLQPTLTRPSQKSRLSKTMRGIRSYMGWRHIPNIDTTTSTLLLGPSYSQLERSL